VVPVDDEVQFYCRDACTPIAPHLLRYVPPRQSAASAAFDSFVGLMNRIMEIMERCDARLKAR